MFFPKSFPTNPSLSQASLSFCHPHCKFSILFFYAILHLSVYRNTSLSQEAQRLFSKYKDPTAEFAMTLMSYSREENGWNELNLFTLWAEIDRNLISYAYFQI